MVMNWYNRYKLADAANITPINPSPLLPQMFDAVEGEGFYVYVQDEIQQAMQRIPDARELAELLGDDPKDSVVATIYGRGGWNRYFVMGDGTVKFSMMHATDEDIRKADKAGFEMF